MMSASGGREIRCAVGAPRATSDSRMRIVLVHNPGAGGTAHDPGHLARLLTAGGHRVEHFSPQDDWLQAVSRGADLVAAAGGDGTVAAVAKTLAGRDVPIAVFPTGTANNIATDLGIAGSD